MKLIALLFIVASAALLLLDVAVASPTKDHGESDLQGMMRSDAAVKEFVQRKLEQMYDDGSSAVKLRWEYPDDGETGVKQFSVDDLVTALFALVTLAESMDEHFPDEDHKDILLSFRNLHWNASSVPRQCSFKCKV
ncbi:hypothetical protein V8B55DRAFT_1563850 [Mucor lusitanicus]|uniref:4a-hydroxytetrahydrobiopterin dehydratase n=2 Tax=Mucor circinelloides f. lusitanicus TaxID=29924 RepID=A0A162U0K6_MUCCL|nr:hypothetical protein FB192DRAFT_1341241 [Mucor lusitanicus]OAD08542.1 hypothetical protein MUCCIDRAFT_158746 [Mucor lusitanicus CBS 277.49]